MRHVDFNSSKAVLSVPPLIQIQKHKEEIMWSFANPFCPVLITSTVHVKVDQINKISIRMHTMLCTGCTQ